MPRTAIDYKSPYTADSLKSHLSGETTTIASCLTILYGHTTVLKETGVFTCDGLTNTISGGSAYVGFLALSEGDTFIMRGWANSANNGLFTVIAVDSEGRDVTVSESLTTEDSETESLDIEIRDGTPITLTAHDQDIIFNGLTYSSITGFDPTAIEFSSDLSDDNFDLVGAFNDNVFSRSGVLNKLYDDAWMEVFLCNYSTPSMGRFVLSRGRLGKFVLNDHGYKVAYNSNLFLLQQDIGSEISPVCRAILGDSVCGVILENYQGTAYTSYLDSTYPNQIFGMAMDVNPSKPTDTTYWNPSTVDASGSNFYDWWFKDGYLTWGQCKLPITAIDAGSKTFTVSGDYAARLISGVTITVADGAGTNDGDYTVVTSILSGSDTVITVSETINTDTLTGSETISFNTGNTGTSYEIRSYDKKTVGGTNRLIIELEEATLYDVNLNDYFILTVGCNKSWTHCVDKFENWVNFDGEPFVPGRKIFKVYD